MIHIQKGPLAAGQTFKPTQRLRTTTWGAKQWMTHHKNMWPTFHENRELSYWDFLRINHLKEVDTRKNIA